MAKQPWEEDYGAGEGTTANPWEQTYDRPLSFLERLQGRRFPSREDQLRASQQLPAIAKSAGSDIVRSATDTIGYGLPDTLAGGDQRQQTEAARKRLGPVSPVVTGIASLYGPAEVKAMKYMGDLAGMVGHGIVGGTSAMVNELGHGNFDPLEVAKAGARGSGATAAISGLVRPVMEAIPAVTRWYNRRTQPRENINQLTADRKAKYAQVDASKAIYPANRKMQLEAELANIKMIPGRDDRAIAFRDNFFKQWGGKDMSPTELDAVRQDWRDTLSKGDERRFGTQAVDAIDKFTKQNPFTSGIEKVLEEGRGLRAQEYKYNTAMQAAKDAERLAKEGRFNPFTPSPESATVKRFSKLDKRIKEGKERGWNPNEEAAVEQLYQGTPMRDRGGYQEKWSYRGKDSGTLGQNLVRTIPAQILTDLGARQTMQEIADLKLQLVNPGAPHISKRADQATVEAARNKLAQVTSGGVRAGQNEGVDWQKLLNNVNPFGGPR